MSESYWKVHKYVEKDVTGCANIFDVSIPILSKNHAKTGPRASPGGPLEEDDIRCRKRGGSIFTFLLILGDFRGLNFMICHVFLETCFLMNKL